MLKRFLYAGILVAAAFYVSCMTPGISKKADDFVVLMRAPEKVANYERDVVWASPGGVDLHMDISIPEGEGPFPVLVWFHGGGWEYFSKEANVGLAKYFTNRGYVVFNMNYRMFPEVTMKTIVEDAMGAFLWAKDHAPDYRGDPSRMALSGHSAGAHLATMVVVACGDPYFNPTYKSSKGNDCSVNCLIPVSGVYDFHPLIESEGEKMWTKIFGATEEENPEVYRKCSPINYLRADLPPQLVVYGERDFLRDNNELWAKSLAETGADVVPYMEAGQKHLWPTWHWKKPTIRTYDRMIDFLDKHLKN